MSSRARKTLHFFVNSRLVYAKHNFFSWLGRGRAAGDHFGAGHVAPWPWKNWEPEINRRPVQAKHTFFPGLEIEPPPFRTAKRNKVASRNVFFWESGACRPALVPPASARFGAKTISNGIQGGSKLLLWAAELQRTVCAPKGKLINALCHIYMHTFFMLYIVYHFMLFYIECYSASPTFN